MDQTTIRTLLEEVSDSRVSPDQAMHRLRHLPFEDLGFAKIDHHRPLRVGMPEVIYSAGKTPEQVAEIFMRIAERSSNVLATRANREKFEAVHERVPQAEFHPLSGCIVLSRNSEKRGRGLVLVICAGTSDIAVAEEAAVTADLMGNEVEQLCDVGVAGLHRTDNQNTSAHKNVSVGQKTWKAHCRASSLDWSRRQFSACRPRLVMAPHSAASPRSWEC